MSEGTGPMSVAVEGVKIVDWGAFVSMGIAGTLGLGLAGVWLGPGSPPVGEGDRLVCGSNAYGGSFP